MIAAPIADVHITGSAATYFVYVLAVPVGLLLLVIARTSPRSPTQSLSRFERRIAPWIWQKQRNRTTAILGALAAGGAITCVLTFFLPVITYSEYPLFPGDPFAGVHESEPTVKGLAVSLGVVLGLLSLRRSVGGEGVTVPISLVLATILAGVAALAFGDFVSNASLGPFRYESAPAAGPGLYTVFAGSVVAWLACAADLAVGIRQSARSAGPRQDGSVAPPPPAPRREYGPGRLIAQSVASGAVFVLLVAIGWLPTAFLIVPVMLIALNTGLEVFFWRRLRGRFHLDRYIVLTAAAALAVLSGVGAWEFVRPDLVLAVPSDTHHVSACAPSVKVPDVGNQVNRSIAGTTTVMTVGSKIYIEDSPVGATALTALVLQGPDVVCAAGGSGFGEVLVATDPGMATLFVHTTSNATYRVQVRVNL